MRFAIEAGSWVNPRGFGRFLRALYGELARRRRNEWVLAMDSPTARAANLPEETPRQIIATDWAAGQDAAIRRFRSEAARRGLATLPPRPLGQGEPAGNSAAAARLEERAQESAADEHRAALYYAAARWIDESGRDLALVVREGNFRKVFPFGALTHEAEAAFRESGAA